MFSMKHEFSTEWYKFLNPPVEGADQVMAITLRRQHFPFFVKDKSVNIKKLEVFIRSNREGEYKMIFSSTDVDENVMTTAEISMAENPKYSNMQSGTVSETTPGVTIDDINVFAPMTFKFRHSTDVSNPQKYNTIDKDPEEISDVFVVMHYFLGDMG